MSGPIRRAVLAAAPVAGLAVALPSVAACEPESEILRRFRECVAFRDLINTAEFAGFEADEELDAACAELRAMEAELIALPSRSLQDLSAKILVLTAYGEGDGWGPSHEAPIIEEAKVLVRL